jgi:hypothetical protein
MQKVQKLLVGIFLFSILFSMIIGYNTQSVAAAQDDEKVNIDDGDHVQEQIKANERVRFRFRDRTRITVESKEKVNVSIDCDAKRIGDKDFEIEIETEDRHNLTMNCKEESNMLGLRKGDTVEVRNRMRHRYQEGFIVEVESSEDDVDAKLRIEENDENRGGTWAYYDKKNEDWVAVETTSKNGYLECETDHFSIWTILVPEYDFTLLLIVGAGIGAAVLVGLAIILIKRRK